MSDMVIVFKIPRSDPSDMITMSAHLMLHVSRLCRTAGTQLGPLIVIMLTTCGIMSFAYASDVHGTNPGADGTHQLGGSETTSSDEDLRPAVHLGLGHTHAGASIAAFSPDGRLFATGGQDRTVHLWDLTADREIRVFKGHSDHITAVAFSPDGRLLASGDWNAQVQLWDMPTGRLIRHLQGIKGNASRALDFLMFSPCGHLLVTGQACPLGQKRLWDVTTGEEIRLTANPDSEVSSIVFSPDGKWLAWRAEELIGIMDTVTHQQMHTITGVRHGILGDYAELAVSPDGHTL